MDNRSNTTSLHSWTIIILGVTGDLARKKILPAICSLVTEHLERNQKCNFILIGAAKDHTTMHELLEYEEVCSKNTQSTSSGWEYLKNISYYISLDFNKPEDFKALATVIEKHEHEHNLPGNRLVYLATAADFYCDITTNLAQAGIVERQKNNGKKQVIVYEKPFGRDLQTARRINLCIEKYVDEEQIYRVDHYLTKTLVSSLALIRFSNVFFEPIWNAKYIDQVQIIFNETIGIDNRGSFYDNYGALKDVMQNHMLQLLSLIAMECPQSLDGNAISLAKSEVLKKARVVTGLLGQYTGYTTESHVRPDSKTETLAVLKCFIDTPRWQEVPFYLKTGKCLQTKATAIHVVFKPVSQALVGASGTFAPNTLTLHIAPDSSLSVTLNAQNTPNNTSITNCVESTLCYTCNFYDHMPHTYQRLLLDILSGDSSITVHSHEIEYAWQVIEHVSALQLPLYTYACGSSGPEQLALFSQVNGVDWLA